MSNTISTSTSFLFSAKAAPNFPADGAFRLGKESAQTYVEDHFGLSLPFSLFEKNYFTTALDETQNNRLSVVSTASLWAIKIENDEQGPDIKSPKTWQTELTLENKNGRVIVTAGQYCLKESDIPVFGKVPAIVHSIAARLGCTDSQQIIPRTPRILTEPHQINRLLRTILDPFRILPIVVIAKNKEQPLQFDPDFVDSKRLCRKLFPAAHVIVLNGAAIDEYASQVGGQWAVPPNTVRTMRPAFSRTMDPADSPLATKSTIRKWESKYYPFRNGPAGFEDFLVRKINKAIVESTPASARPQRFDSIRARLLDGARP